MTTIRHDLSADQPAAPAPSAVVDGAVSALLDGQTHYVEVGGVEPLVARLQAMLEEHAPASDPPSSPPSVLVTAGIQEARFLAIQIVGERIGHLALPAVVDPGARRAASVRALPLTTLPALADTGFLPAPRAIAEALEGGTRLVYLESPSRFSGAAYEPETLVEIAALIVAHDATVIWDQGLAPWVHRWEYASILAQPGMAKRAVVLGETWPGVGLESWFVGYLAASAATIGVIRTYKQIISICTSTAAQYAAVAAAEVYPALHRQQVEALAESYESGLDRARSLGLTVVEGATATLLTVAVTDMPAALAELASAGIRVADGAEFGAPGLLRLAATTDDALVSAIERLADTETSAGGGYL
jgi:octopine/nopaline transport system ATP-binding protein